MLKADIEALPMFYKRYVEPIKDEDLIGILKESMKTADILFRSIPESKQDHRYGNDKWTIREIMCHLLDVERVMAYRSLRFARNDKTPLPGFEENDYTPESNPGSRTIETLSGELVNLRTSTIDLFNSYSHEMMLRKGIANDMEFSVVNLGYIIAGHTLHHCRIVTERYLS